MSIRTARIPTTRAIPRRTKTFGLRRRHRRWLKVAAVLLLVVASAFIAGYKHRAITQGGLRYSSDDVSRFVENARHDAYRQGLRKGQRLSAEAASDAVTSTCTTVFGVGRVRHDGWRVAAERDGTAVRAIVWQRAASGERDRFTREDCVATGQDAATMAGDAGTS